MNIQPLISILKSINLATIANSTAEVEKMSKQNPLLSAFLTEASCAGFNFDSNDELVECFINFSAGFCERANN